MRGEGGERGSGRGGGGRNDRKGVEREEAERERLDMEGLVSSMKRKGDDRRRGERVDRERNVCSQRQKSLAVDGHADGRRERDSLADKPLFLRDTTNVRGKESLYDRAPDFRS